MVSDLASQEVSFIALGRPGLPRGIFHSPRYELYGGTNWASEASPILGCSNEISHDIYIYTIVTMEIAMKKEEQDCRMM